MVSYYDRSRPPTPRSRPHRAWGVIFAFAGIFASSLYTVWIASYHRKLQMSSMQLLFNQAPVSAFLLLYIIPLSTPPRVEHRPRQPLGHDRHGKLR